MIKNLFIFILIFSCFKVLGQSNKPSSKPLYQSKNLEIIPLSENSFQHISFLKTDDFGLVPCNGLIVRQENQVVIFDTPVNDESSEELILWIEQVLKAKIKIIIPTHFHDDCLGGLNAFHHHQIISLANNQTILLAKEKGALIPRQGFNKKKKIRLGSERIFIKFFGEGHTKDNVVGYFPKEKVLFGGCLIKELGANKGYLGDANLGTWANTVELVREAYPKAEIVIPGHGLPGNISLLDYTIQLFN